MLTFKNKSSLSFYMNSLETIQLSNEKCITEIYKQYKLLLTKILHCFTLIIPELLILFHFSHSCSVDKLCLTLRDPVDCSRLFPCPSPSSGACWNSCPLSQWCHPTISSCRPLLLLPSIFPSIRVFSNESALHITWPEYWSFSFSISLSSEYSGWISFRIDLFDLLAVQGTLKSLLQHHNLKASILWCSAFFGNR